MRKNTAENHLSNISINDLWETPYGMLEQFCEKENLPVPSLDVCGTQKNKKCERVLEKPNGLKSLWNEDFFCNFPYSESEAWMKNAFNSHSINNVNGIILAFNKSGNKWYHKYVYNEDRDIYYAKVVPIRGRVKFLLDGKKYMYYSKKEQQWRNGTAPYDSCWILYKKDVPYFKLEPKIV